jgi:hypothetical protein
VAYLAEAAATVVIVETTSTGTALGISKAMPFAITAVLVGWMVFYGQRAKRRGELAGQVARDAGAHGGVIFVPTKSQPGPRRRQATGSRFLTIRRLLVRACSRSNAASTSVASGSLVQRLPTC